MQSFASLRESLDKIRKDATEAFAQAKSAAKDVVSSGESRVHELRSKEKILMPELESNCMYTSQLELLVTACKKTKNCCGGAEDTSTDNKDTKLSTTTTTGEGGTTDTSAPTQTNIQTNAGATGANVNTGNAQQAGRDFVCAERAFARAAACEREVILPQIRKLANDNRIDRSTLMGVQLLEEHLKYIEDSYGILGKYYQDPNCIQSCGFRCGMNCIQKDLCTHHDRLKPLLMDFAKKATTEQENHDMVEKMKDIYVDIPREPFVAYGSITGKFSSAIQRFGDVLGGATASSSHAAEKTTPATTGDTKAAPSQQAAKVTNPLHSSSVTGAGDATHTTDSAGTAGTTSAKGISDIAGSRDTKGISDIAGSRDTKGISDIAGSRDTKGISDIAGSRDTKGISDIAGSRDTKGISDTTGVTGTAGTGGSTTGTTYPRI